MNIEKLIWSVKQLLPLKYETNYSNNEGKFNCVWRMWFGKPFNIIHTKL